MANQVDVVNQVAEGAATQLGELLHTLVHRFRGGPGAGRGSAALPEMEGRALGFFMRQPGATASQLVAHSGRDKAQIARLVASLREQGLLEARADELDRRVMRLYPTAAAAAVHAVLRQAREARVARALQALSPVEQDQLLALLRRLDEAPGD